MPDFRFLHAADIHLDSPMRGLERYPDAPVEVVRNAPRRALENLIDLAIEERVAFLPLAGDLYDGDWKDYNTGIFFGRQMRRLAEVGIPVFLVSGNHDATSRITRKLSLPDNVRHFGSAAPETVEIAELGVAIHGQSFAERSVSDDLSATYPTPTPGRLDIGLLHTSLDGRPGHADYAPCTLDGLRSKGYDYWALGHVHAREIVSESPWVVFPGNLQGRHARETGAKGATLVSVEGGRIVDLDHRSVDVLRWARLEVDVSSAHDGEQALDQTRAAVEESLRDADERLLAVRISLTGHSEAHGELTADVERWTVEIREVAGQLGGAGVWVEKVSIDTTAPRDLAAALERGDVLGEMLRRLEDLDDSPERLEELADGFADLAKKLPPALLRDDDGFDPTNPEVLRARMPAARDRLLARLLDAGSDE